MKTQYVWNMCNIGTGKQAVFIGDKWLTGFNCPSKTLPVGTGYKFENSTIYLTGVYTGYAYGSILTPKEYGYYIGTCIETSGGGYDVTLTATDNGGAVVRYYRSGDENRISFYRVQDANIKGTYIKAVTADTESAYPKNGVSGGYWYEYDKSETVAGDYIETVSSFDPGAYPTNGEKDGYWYTII